MGTKSHVHIWRQIEGEALIEWTRHYPGTRPASWWRWAAPGLRQIRGRFTIVDGAGRCHASGIPFGVPVDWHDPPMVESVPAFLDRHRLWLPGERARVPAAAFAPQRFDWTLTVAPIGAPYGDDDEDDPRTLRGRR